MDTLLVARPLRDEGKFVVYEEFRDLPPAYDHLFDQASRESLYLGRSWFETLTRNTLAENQPVKLFAVEGDDRTPLALLVMRAPSGSPSDPHSGFLSSLSNYYSMEYAPLLGQGVSIQPALHALAIGLMQDRPRWSGLTLQALDRGSEVFDALVSALRAAGFVVCPFFQFGNWYVDTAGTSFERYLRERPSVLRNTYRRRLNSLEKSGKGHYHLVTSPEGLEEAITAYDQVYSSSWKSPENHPHFIPELLRSTASRGQLRLGILRIDGSPAAAQIWLVHGGRATIYKLAYDERFKDLSVGTLLTAYLMRHVIDVDRVHEIDYGSGDDPYKQQWMSSRRERWGLVAYNPATIRGALGIGASFFRDATKTLNSNAKAALKIFKPRKVAPSS